MGYLKEGTRFVLCGCTTSWSLHRHGDEAFTGCFE